MTQETDLQTDLKDAAIAAGGFAFKMSNRFLVGVPDLFIKLPNLPIFILEVKYAPKPLKNGIVWVELTAHQERYIKSINAAGGAAGWIMITKLKTGMYVWSVGRIPIRAYIPIETDPFHTKMRGQPWAVQRIIEELISC